MSDKDIITSGQRPMMVKKAHKKIRPTGLQKYKMENQLVKKRRADYSDMYWLLDTSGSMAGDKIAQLIETVEYLLPKYPLVHMITFGSGTNRISEERVPHLYAAGHTPMLRALDMAWACSPSEIVLITDGDPTDAPRGKIIDEAERHGVPISCIGIGEDYKREFLDALADVTGGTSTDVATEDLDLLTETMEQVLQITDGQSDKTINL
jgi:Mg-chelatase subunit ChlD